MALTGSSQARGPGKTYLEVVEANDLEKRLGRIVVICEESKRIVSLFTRG